MEWIYKILCHNIVMFECVSPSVHYHILCMWFLFYPFLSLSAGVVYVDGRAHQCYTTPRLHVSPMLHYVSPPNVSPLVPLSLLQCWRGSDGHVHRTGPPDAAHTRARVRGRAGPCLGDALPSPLHGADRGKEQKRIKLIIDST